jgi:peptidoglycan/xylan/chitin deacetylase (PgdA/CDA1 family)
MAQGAEHPDRHYLEERYQRPGRSSRLLPAYYALKPLIPRSAQLALRRAYAPRQAARKFPRWPIEPLLVERQHEEFRRRLASSGQARVPFVNFWPHGARFAYVVTHDVEGPAGIENLDSVREVERRHGIVSSWNFVAEEYPIPAGTFERVRAQGCEVGLHGITHDGYLFRSRRHFDEQLPKVHRYRREWDVEGFRSPATHRNADWMDELGCRYDSSFPDTDPFEPQPGGCCSIFPFRLGATVELPITLVQDHTMWEILREPGIEPWMRKGRWIAEHHGLVNVIVHPDYVRSADRLELYSRFLGWLGALTGGWHALPREVAAWWRAREQMSVDGDAGAVTGAGEHAATVAWAQERDGRIVFETGS